MVSSRRVAALAALAALLVACNDGYSDNCPSSVGTPGTVQCAHDVCNLGADSGWPGCCARTADGGATVRGGKEVFSLTCDDATDCPVGHLCCAQSGKGTGPYFYLTGCAASWDECAHPEKANPNFDSFGSVQLCVADCECHDNGHCVDGVCN